MTLLQKIWKYSPSSIFCIAQIFISKFSFLVKTFSFQKLLQLVQQDHFHISKQKVFALFNIYFILPQIQLFLVWGFSDVANSKALLLNMFLRICFVSNMKKIKIIEVRQKLWHSYKKNCVFHAKTNATKIIRSCQVTSSSLKKFLCKSEIKIVPSRVSSRSGFQKNSHVLLVFSLIRLFSALLCSSIILPPWYMVYDWLSSRTWYGFRIWTTSRCNLSVSNSCNMFSICCQFFCLFPLAYAHRW